MVVNSESDGTPNPLVAVAPVQGRGHRGAKGGLGSQGRGRRVHRHLAAVRGRGCAERGGGGGGRGGTSSAATSPRAELQPLGPVHGVRNSDVCLCRVSWMWKVSKEQGVGQHSLVNHG